MFRLFASAAAVLFALGAVALEALAAPPQYVFTEVPHPSPYVPGPTGINNRGDVFGTNYAGSQPHAVVYTADGTYQTLPGVPGFPNMVASGINDAGDVVGTASPDSPAPGNRGFLYHNGTVTNLAPDMTLGSNFAFGISNTGYIVGWTTSGNTSYGYRRLGDAVTDLGLFHGQPVDARVVNDAGHVAGMGRSAPGGPVGGGAFLWRDGVMTDLGTLGSPDMSVRAINNSDQIVGNAATGAGQPRAFLYSDGVITDILGLNVQSQANGINDAGQVVGMVETLPSHGWHGFLYDHGSVTDLNDVVTLPAGWTILGGWDINERGQILVNAADAAGAAHDLVLTPVPEPTAALVAIPAGLCLLRRKRPSRG